MREGRSSIRNRDKLEMIANSLLEYETLEGTQVEEIIRTGKFTPPPATAQSGAAQRRDRCDAFARSAKACSTGIAGLGHPRPGGGVGHQ